MIPKKNKHVLVGEKDLMGHLNELIHESGAFKMVDSILVYGSLAREEFHPEWSNINLLVLSGDAVYPSVSDQNAYEVEMHSAITEGLKARLGIGIELSTRFPDDRLTFEDLCKLRVLFHFRPPNYLTLKSEQQPLYIINLCTQCCIIGGRLDLSEAFEKAVSNCSTSKLVEGKGGILETLRLHKSYSWRLLHSNPIAATVMMKHFLVQIIHYLCFLNGEYCLSMEMLIDTSEKKFPTFITRALKDIYQAMKRPLPASHQCLNRCWQTLEALSTKSLEMVLTHWVNLELATAIKGARDAFGKREGMQRP